ncbi:hypothetical protein DFH09DRAFT_1309937 [Mycena vulgaris]|nr:hypothetical protein DFH09DRAFT_1309937 [Mycena vulgaris]
MQHPLIVPNSFIRALLSLPPTRAHCLAHVMDALITSRFSLPFLRPFHPPPLLLTYFPASPHRPHVSPPSPVGMPYLRLVPFPIPVSFLFPFPPVPTPSYLSLASFYTSLVTRIVPLPPSCSYPPLCPPSSARPLPPLSCLASLCATFPSPRLASDPPSLPLRVAPAFPPCRSLASLRVVPRLLNFPSSRLPRAPFPPPTRPRSPSASLPARPPSSSHSLSSRVPFADLLTA